MELCGKKRAIESNEVEANMIDVTITKEQSCNYVFNEDEIEYTVTIFNDSCVCLYDLVFSDTISDNSEYVENSFTVNGIKYTPDIDKDTIIYEIEKIDAREEIIIKFTVKVKCNKPEVDPVEPVIETSDSPAINTIYKHDLVVYGTGIAGAIIEFTMPNGTILTAVVNENGSWSVDIPSQYKLQQNDVVSAIQTESGKTTSEAVYATVAK